MAPQSPEEEKYDLINLKTRVLEDAGTSMPDFEKVYCIPEGDDWEFENVLGRFSRASGATRTARPGSRRA